jgi:hypothetical protein
MNTISIVEMLQRLGSLEWYSVRPSELTNGIIPSGCVPVVTFRYTEGNNFAFQRIRSILSGYDGGSRWSILGLGEKNLTIAPAEIVEENVASLTRAHDIQVSDPELALKIEQSYRVLIDRLNAELIE